MRRFPPEVSAVVAGVKVACESCRAGAVLRGELESGIPVSGWPEERRMILLKCPRCGKAAEAPDELARAGEKCYTCGVSVEADHLPRRFRWGSAFRCCRTLVTVLGAAIFLLLA